MGDQAGIVRSCQEYSIKSLPKEMLLSIAESLPQKSLLSLGLTCRDFQNSFGPLLYRWVYFWEAKEFWWYRLYQLDQVIDCMARLQKGSNTNRRVSVYQPTQIFDLSLFLRTVDECPKIRSQVVAVGFECNSEQFYGEVLELIDLLAPSTQFLHLWPVSSEDTMKLELPTAHLTSLSIEYSDLRAAPEAPIDRDRMYGMFCIPTLRRLEIREVRSWEGFRGPAPAFLKRTSPIVDLSFPNSCPVGTNLEEILEWPISLRTFHYTISYSRESTVLLRPSKIRRFLDPQKSSLEVLQIFLGEARRWDYDGSVLGTFNDFPELRRIGIPLSFMVETLVEFSDEENFPAMEQFLNLHEMLPKRLVELELQLHRSFSWYEKGKGQSPTDSPTGDIDFSALSSADLNRQRRYGGHQKITTGAARLVVKWLLEMARHKRERFPLLAGVALLKWTDHFRHKIYKAGDLGGDEECLELLSAFEDVDIVLDYIEPRSKLPVGGFRP